MFRTLFTAIIRPHLEYGAPVWNPHLRKWIDMIENVQRRASKMVPCLSDLSYKQRLEALKLPTLQYRRYRGDMIEMFKLSHGYYDEVSVEDFIKFGVNNTDEIRLRGHRYHVNKFRFKKDVRKYSFKCRVT